MDQIKLDKLYEDFKVEIKPGGQGFKYVRTRNILDRLNKTFEGNWGLNIKHHELIDDEVLVLVSVNLYDNEGNITATQEGFGSAKKFRGVELGNIYKSATSKAIKSAVRNWGVALFLDEEIVEGTQTGRSSSTTPNISGPPQSIPSSGAIPPTTNINTLPKPPSSGMPPSSPVPLVTPAKDVPSSTPTGNTNVPPSNAASEKPEQANAQIPPISNTGSSLPPMEAVPGQVPTPDATGMELSEITAVQKVAITSRLTAKSLTFEQVVDEFYSTRASNVVASIEDMLYIDALDMVAFLNTK